MNTSQPQCGTYIQEDDLYVTGIHMSKIYGDKKILFSRIL